MDTPLLNNQYFVMKWDFSLVKAQGDVKDIEAALHRHLNNCIQEFALRYQARLPYRRRQTRRGATARRCANGMN